MILKNKITPNIENLNSILKEYKAPLEINFLSKYLQSKYNNPKLCFYFTCKLLEFRIDDELFFFKENNNNNELLDNKEKNYRKLEEELFNVLNFDLSFDCDISEDIFFIHFIIRRDKFLKDNNDGNTNNDNLNTLNLNINELNTLNNPNKTTINNCNNYTATITENDNTIIRKNNLRKYKKFFNLHKFLSRKKATEKLENYINDTNRLNIEPFLLDSFEILKKIDSYHEDERVEYFYNKEKYFFVLMSFFEDGEIVKFAEIFSLDEKFLEKCFEIKKEIHY